MNFEIKVDCFAHREHKNGKPYCVALNELFCAKEKCVFYKPMKRDESEASKQDVTNESNDGERTE